jgi:hypothetical protein
VNLTSPTVLELWEAGLHLAPAPRAELLLQATGEDDISGWSVGRRDSSLLERYCPGEGPIDALADCPVCGAVMDVSVDPQLLTSSPTNGQVTVEQGGYVVSARPPTVADLQDLPTNGDEQTMRGFLLERCVVSATRGDQTLRVGDLPGDVVDQVELALDEADPAADIRLELTCEECQAPWTESLDPVLFAWSAVESSARRLATDVHLLAHSYGWSEQDILALSPFRRHLYLSAVAP